MILCIEIDLVSTRVSYNLFQNFDDLKIKEKENIVWAWNEKTS